MVERGAVNGGVRSVVVYRLHVQIHISFLFSLIGWVATCQGLRQDYARIS